MFGDNDRTKNLMQTVPVVVMILVIVVLIYTLILYNNETESARREFIEIGSNLTGQSAQAMEMWLEDQRRMSGLIADHPVIVAACEDPENYNKGMDAQTLLEELNARYAYYEALPVAVFTDEAKHVLVEDRYITVENGEFFVDSVGGNIVGKGGLDLSYVRAISEGRPYFVSEVYPSINSGEPIIAISHPVHSNGKVIGASVVAPKIEHFTSRFVESAKYGESGYMFILDSRGLTVSHPDHRNIMKSYEEQGQSEQRIINRILTGQTFFQDKYQNSDKSYYVKRVTSDTEHQPYDWYMVFTMSNTEIYANAERLLQISISMLIGGSITIAVILYMYTSSFEMKVREIQQLEMSRKLEVEVAARTSQLAEMAIRDGLTKLYNHEATYKALEVSVMGSRVSLAPLSVIMIDLDNFKSLNDAYGHPFGDAVLKETAKVLRESVRSTDIVGRYGGEEFLVILPGAPKQSAIKTAGRISEGLTKVKFDEPVKITASQGVVVWLGEDAGQLISRADKLLYQAKHKGRDRIESTLDVEKNE